jgi:putative CocE/NonD family hydrolase
MRDGVELSADVYLPDGPGPHPTVLVRTPYVKANPFDPKLGRKYAARGYVYVVQDARGKGDSDGKFSFLVGDGEDGYDTVEWIARQPWSNGKIGIEGSSYRASMAWAAARERPPHLTCMISQVPVADHFDHGPGYVGGAFNTGWALSWVFGVTGRSHQVPVVEAWPGFFDLLEKRPLLTLDSVMGKRLPIYRDWLRHSTFDDYWKRLTFTPENYRGIDIPILALTGWFDLTQSGTMFHWNGLQKHSPAKDRQHILIGPWPHNVNLGRQTKYGGFQFSEESNLDMDSVRLSFWDYCLKGTSKAFEFPRARVYVMGSNVWRDLDAYPPREAESRSLYLTSGGRANTLSGDGRLTWTISSDGQPDRYTYDPKRPVPSRKFDTGQDQTANQRREDVLVYSTEVLTEPVEIVGPVEVVLHAATDARDTDFVVKLTDVYPDGKALLLGPKQAGVIRARYRKGFDREVLVTPGAVEEYRIRIGDVGHAFLPGHRIRIEVTSSAAPWINPNQNTGNPVATDTDWKVAQQTIYHDRARPSRVVLPMMPKR